MNKISDCLYRGVICYGILMQKYPVSVRNTDKLKHFEFGIFWLTSIFYKQYSVIFCSRKLLNNERLYLLFHTLICPIISRIKFY